MTDFFKQHRVADPEIAEEGVWVEGAYRGILDLKIRRANSKYSQEVMRRLRKRMRNPSTTQEEKTVKQWAAEGVLIDWRASEGVTEQPPACTTENVLQAMEDDPELLQAITDFANEEETFRAERLEEEAGNSSTTSSGSSSTASAKSSSSTA